MNALNRDLKKLVNFIEKNEKERVNKDYWRLKSVSYTHLYIMIVL